MIGIKDQDNRKSQEGKTTWSPSNNMALKSVQPTCYLFLQK